MANGDLLTALLEVAAGRRDPEKVDPKRLGRWLMKYKGRVAAGLRIVKGEDTDKKIALWRVVPASIPTAPPPKPEPDSDINGVHGVHSTTPREKNEKSLFSDDSSIDIHIGKKGVAGNGENSVNPVNTSTDASDEKPMEPHEADDNRLKLKDCRALKVLRGLYATQKQNLVEAGRPDAVPRIRMWDWTRIAPRKEVDALIAAGMVVTDPGGFVSEAV